MMTWQWYDWFALWFLFGTLCLVFLSINKMKGYDDER